MRGQKAASSKTHREDGQQLAIEMLVSHEGEREGFCVQPGTSQAVLMIRSSHRLVTRFHDRNRLLAENLGD